ncbi:unnamed protein product, partial [Rotaria sp. Silwood1]
MKKKRQKQKHQNSNKLINSNQSLQIITKKFSIYVTDFLIDPCGLPNELKNCILVNETNQGEGMDQTLLVGSRPISIVVAQYCNGLKISSLSIDFDSFPFTADYVVNISNSYLDVRVKSPHRTDIFIAKFTRFFALIQFEIRPAFGSKVYQIFQTSPSN